MKQITLGIEVGRKSEPPITLNLEQRRRLVELMAAAIIAVHRAKDEPSPEDVDDDSRD